MKNIFKKEVTINIPLFIGLILLVASVTTVLLSGLKMTIDYILESNRKINQQFQIIENYIPKDEETNSEQFNYMENIDNTI